jgi:hypothetical protein
MLNTLANHGFIPRNGRGMSREAVFPGLRKALNLAEDLSFTVWSRGLLANQTEGADRFDLAQLRVHNVLEHDASLT